jgi:hypothetical protein
VWQVVLVGAFAYALCHKDEPEGLSAKTTRCNGAHHVATVQH